MQSSPTFSAVPTKTRQDRQFQDIEQINDRDVVYCRWFRNCHDQLANCGFASQLRGSAIANWPSARLRAISFRNNVIGEVEATMRAFIPAPCRGTPLRRREACRSDHERAVIRSTRPVSPVLISTMVSGGNELACAPRPEHENCVEGTRNNGTPRTIDPSAVSRVGRPSGKLESAGAVSRARHGRIALTRSGPRPLLLKGDIQQSSPCGPETSESINAIDQ